MATNQTTVVQFGNAGTSGDIGTTVQLVERTDGSGKSNLLLTSPLSVEINIDNNNSPSDQVIFTAGSGNNRRVIATLDQNGDLSIKGSLKQNMNFD